MAIRAKLLFILFLLGFLGLSARLFHWQIVMGSELANSARNQYQYSNEVSAPRGNILASDGSFWAMRSSNFLLWANPKQIKLTSERVQELADILEMEKQEILDLITKDSMWIALKHRVDLDTKKKVEDLSIEGLGFDNEEGRFYPEASVGAQILGFVGKDENGSNLGYFGLEGNYNIPLSGKTGFVKGERNALGQLLELSNKKGVSAISGVDLVTSIDKRIQFTLYNKLKEGIEKYGAKSGSVVVMDPKTGEVLGMESFPSFDPTKYWEYEDSVFKNPIISDSFEPGSIFKVIVMASALDAQKVEPDTICEICDGPLKIDKYLIETWNKEYTKDATMTDVIVHSDNVGMSYVGQKMGASLLYDYLSKFGFGRNTGIDLQGEFSPKLREKNKWSEVDLVTTTFGQGIAVTPLQMVTAVSAIANKGVLMQPHVVKEIRSGGDSDEIKPKGERVISEEASDKITQMMMEAASNGESKWTSLSGFRVAGKTGTAQIPIAGHYDAEKTNASFVAFAPAEDPKFVMLVILREPQTSIWASETAAPLWYSIAKDLFPYFGIQPKN